MEKLLKLNRVKEVVDWSSPGVVNKPDHCRLCALAAVGKAYVKDYTPSNPKIAFLLGTPTREDAIENVPFSGSMGAHLTKLFITDLGLNKEDVLISHVIRCVQPTNQYGKREYPTSFLQRAGEMNCRFYDTELNTFDPNVFILTLDPATIFGINAHIRQIQRDIEKAISFTKKGYRCALLMGDGPSSLYFPAMKGNGGIKNFRGHFWQGTLPYKNKVITEKDLNRKLFLEG